MESGDKVRENRLRRAAARQGLLLRKCRRRDRRALDYGAYLLVDARTNTLVASDGLTLDQVHMFLTDGVEW